MKKGAARHISFATLAVLLANPYHRAKRQVGTRLGTSGNKYKPNDRIGPRPPKHCGRIMRALNTRTPSPIRQCVVCGDTSAEP